MSSGWALALNSSYFGFYTHVGFLAELHRRFGTPAQVSGSSAGALVAGLYAGGVPLEQMTQLLLQTNFRKLLNDWSVPVRATQLLFNRKGVTGALRSHRAAELLRSHLKIQRIEECTNPGLTIGVTNLTTSRSETLQSGPLAELIVASCAFPGLFSAHDIDGQKYWDGGIGNPAPIEQWIDDSRIGTIIVHFVANEGEMKARESGPGISIFDAVGLSHQIVSDEIFRLQSELALRAGKRLLILRTITPRPGLTKRHLGPSLVEMGRQTVSQNLAALNSLFDARASLP